jgi:hypothetical protein
VSTAAAGQARRLIEREALDRLEAGIGSGGRGAGGPYETLAALNERRVELVAAAIGLPLP